MDEKLLNSMITLRNIGRMTVKDAVEKGLLELPHNKDYRLDEFTLSEQFYSSHEGLLGYPLLTTTICPVCKKEFTFSTWQERTYCSSECCNLYQQEEREGKSYEQIYGKERAEEIKDKIRKRWEDPVYCAKQSKRFSKLMEEKWKDPEYRKNKLKIMKERWNDPEYVANQSNKKKKLWEDPVFRKMMKEALGLRPNCFEKEFGMFFPELTYTGDFSFFVGSKNPDFILKGTNKCVDLFGDPWHKESEIQKRIEYFSQRGYELLIVWESEWEDDKDRDIIQRVNEFLGV